jgi:hypothetical protein
VLTCLYQPSRDGGTGRRSGLKIRRGSPLVGVQLPLPAPKTSQDDGIDRGPSRFALRISPFDFAQGRHCGLRRPQNGSSSTPPPGTICYSDPRKESLPSPTNLVRLSVKRDSWSIAPRPYFVRQLKRFFPKYLS